ncbi:MAG: LysM peptidoglycan-binding domain-containing protein [Halioglobus sp.]|nr:LysM peptidoglycan-binding domain-containing protein [Halioglobus sp.]
MQLQKLIIAISIFASLAACQTMAPQSTATVQPPQAAPVPATDTEPSTAPTTTPASAPARAQEVVQAPAQEPPPEESPPEDLWQRIRQRLSWSVQDNPQIERARDQFLRQPDYLPVVSQRAAYYLHYIVEEVEKRDLPMEIALLPLVESTLDPFASSHSHAAGLWQIMPATGRYLGLEQDWWYDGRRAVRDSTRGALDYLESLYSEFDGDWLLALAAYNSGKGRVARARRANDERGQPTDYWSLRLPRETRNYVPRLLALSQIVAQPDSFDLHIPTVPNAPAFEVAATGGQLELARAAELAGIELSTLRALNPGQLRWATSPDMAPELLLPVGVGERFAREVASLSPDDRVQWRHYRIERGDSLIRIAKKFDTQVGLLREVNGIRGSRIRAGDTLMIPRGAAWPASLALASAPARATVRDYRVRSGDSLYRIAGKFKVSINDIITWNELDPGKYLQPGQQLTLYVSDG